MENLKAVNKLIDGERLSTYDCLFPLYDNIHALYLLETFSLFIKASK